MIRSHRKKRRITRPVCSSVPIDIVELTPGCETEYAAFAARHPASMIYSSLEFRAFLERVAGGEPRYLLAVQDGRIVGTLPLFVVNDSRVGVVINSLPWYGTHGGCLVADDTTDDVRVALLSRYKTIVTDLKAAFATLISYPHETQFGDVYARVLQPVATDVRISQITHLPEDAAGLEDRLLMTCRQKTRNLVRKGLKQGFTYAVEDTEDAWRFLYATHAANLEAIGGRAKPREHFNAIRDCIPDAWRQLVVVRLDQVPVAAMLLLRYNRTVEYITPVIEQRFRAMQPLSFAIWHAMLDAIRAGYRHWNWGGTWTTQRSLHHFKEGWGAAERPYSYYVHASADGLARFAADRDSVCNAFPYYFLFPFSRPAS
jgi:hypothetical protein